MSALTSSVSLAPVFFRVGLLAEDGTVVDFRNGKINYLMPGRIFLQIAANNLKLPNMQLLSNDVYNLGEFFLPYPDSSGVVKLGKEAVTFSFGECAASVRLATTPAYSYEGVEEIILRPTLVSSYFANLKRREILNISKMLRLTKAKVFQFQAINGALKISAAGELNTGELFILPEQEHNFPEGWKGVFPSSHELLRVEEYSYGCSDVTIEATDNYKNSLSPLLLSFKEIDLSAVIPQLVAVPQFLER